jgi:hypothetical protein
MSEEHILQVVKEQEQLFVQMGFKSYNSGHTCCGYFEDDVFKVNLDVFLVKLDPNNIRVTVVVSSRLKNKNKFVMKNKNKRSQSFGFPLSLEESKPELLVIKSLLLADELFKSCVNYMQKKLEDQILNTDKLKTAFETIKNNDRGITKSLIVA